MLYANLESASVNDYQKLLRALTYLKTENFLMCEPGRVELDESIYAQILTYETEDVSEVKFEKHRKRLDLHYIVSGEEIIYVSSNTNLKAVSKYNEQRDLEFLETPSHVNKIILKEGDFLLIGMAEPHKTNGQVNNKSSAVKKVVLKIKQD